MMMMTFMFLIIIIVYQAGFAWRRWSACSKRNTIRSASWMAYPQVRAEASKHIPCKKKVMRISKSRTLSLSFEKMVDQADALHERQELQLESQIDKEVLHECLLLCSVEVAKKNNLESCDSGRQCWTAWLLWQLTADMMTVLNSMTITFTSLCTVPKWLRDCKELLLCISRKKDSEWIQPHA